MSSLLPYRLQPQCTDLTDYVLSSLSKNRILFPTSLSRDAKIISNLVMLQSLDQLRVVWFDHWHPPPHTHKTVQSVVWSAYCRREMLPCSLCRKLDACIITVHCASLVIDSMYETAAETEHTVLSVLKLFVRTDEKTTSNLFRLCIVVPLIWSP